VSTSVAATIAHRKDAGAGTLIAYLPLGYPDLETSIEACIAVLDGGADVLELGVPYSDPLMDGVVIAKATQIALEAGFKLHQIFPAISRITQATDKPVLVMTYWNPVVQYGIERFATELKNAGGAGLITPDLIPDEAAEWLEVSDRLELERVFLAAPSSSDERLGASARVSHGFVYAVSTMGITGTRVDVDSAAEQLVGRIYAQGATATCVGLGISTADHVRNVVSFADGAIVGSALVRALGEGGVEAVRTLARELASGTQRS
jgi:tryptophan synthase alpha chain